MEQARWGFEAGLEGWEAAPDRRDVNALSSVATSSTRSHGGTSSLVLEVATPPVTPSKGTISRALARKVICAPAMADLRGKRFSAWFRLDGPPIPIGQAGCFVNFGTGTESGREAWGGATTSSAQGSAEKTLFPQVGTWENLVGYFWDDVLAQAELKPPLSVGVSCRFDGSKIQWAGTIYVDDVSIE